eukprot:c37881_g1_i1.p1 GENE.c37881_g1_i1~~c37881_g1_i1.p1  ORF type:complete len:101 (+),score=12.56 c37881_g1_i1:115-417(+)
MCKSAPFSSLQHQAPQTPDALNKSGSELVDRHDATGTPLDPWVMTCDECGIHTDGLANLLRHKSQCKPSIDAHKQYHKSLEATSHKPGPSRIRGLAPYVQ